RNEIYALSSQMAAQPFNNGNGFLANPPSVWGAPHSFMSDLSDDDDELQGKCNIGLAEELKGYYVNPRSESTKVLIAGPNEIHRSRANAIVPPMSNATGFYTDGVQPQMFNGQEIPREEGGDSTSLSLEPCSSQLS
ncbi:hypothetical protein AX14_013417, partial [Amanita brunnescens Koide BX004]